jgi:hypothetical protein
MSREGGIGHLPGYGPQRDNIFKNSPNNSPLSPTILIPQYVRAQFNRNGWVNFYFRGPNVSVEVRLVTSQVETNARFSKDERCIMSNQCNLLIYTYIPLTLYLRRGSRDMSDILPRRLRFTKIIKL